LFICLVDRPSTLQDSVVVYERRAAPD
jgi:hypothetical protein